MYRSLLSIVLTLIFMQYSHAQSDSTAKANQIIKIEQQLCDALPGDSSAWAKYLDPKWYLIDEDGDGHFKNDFLRTFKPFPKSVSGNIRVTKPVLSFHGDIAVIHYVADEHENYYGSNLHTCYATMDTWYKTDTS